MDDDLQPALLLDVDGVLNPFAAKGPPAGYREHRFQPGLLWGPDGLRVWLHPGHGSLIIEFANRYHLEPIWATTWEEEANAWIAPRIGLHTALPVIQFSGSGGFGKQPVVDKWAGDRPIAWLDDSFGPDDAQWAQERTADGAPTLLVSIRPDVGLRVVDLYRVADWASGL